MLVGARGQIELVNRRTEELFGYEPGELIDREVELLVPDRFRAGHLAHRAGYVADPRTREMGAGLELYGRRRDGSEFPVEISLSPMRAEGDELVIAIVRDVSERRAAERERLELALEQAALRRVATLVARGVQAEELFAAVTEEVARLLGVDHAHLGRYRVRRHSDDRCRLEQRRGPLPGWRPMDPCRGESQLAGRADRPSGADR